MNGQRVSRLAAERVYGFAPEIPEWLQIGAHYAKQITSCNSETIWLRGDIEVTIPCTAGEPLTSLIPEWPTGAESVVIPSPDWPCADLRYATGEVVCSAQPSRIGLGYWEVWGYAVWVAFGNPVCEDRPLQWVVPDYTSDAVARLALIGGTTSRLPPKELTEITAKLKQPWGWALPSVVYAIAGEEIPDDQ